MIIRKGFSGIKYTHDSEAAYAEIRTYRELLHVSDEDLRGFILERENYTPSYWYSEEHNLFWSVDKNPNVLNFKKVTLHCMHYLGRNFLRVFGYSCLCCRTPTHFLDSGGWLGEEIDSAVRKRQSIECGVLLCFECTFLFQKLISSNSKDELRFTLERIISRITGLPEQRPPDLRCQPITSTRAKAVSEGQKKRFKNPGVLQKHKETIKESYNTGKLKSRIVVWTPEMDKKLEDLYYTQKYSWLKTKGTKILGVGEQAVIKRLKELNLFKRKKAL